MTLSDLRSVLAGLTSFKDFRVKLFDEMKEYKSASHISGKSMPVYLIDNIDLLIGKNELKALCEAFLNDELSESEINYVADALLLSNRVSFVDEDISDRIGYLTDPEINGHLTKDIVRGILTS